MHNTPYTDPESAHNLTFYLDDEMSMLDLGNRMANFLRPGLTLFLYGNLGAGKTTLARGILHGLGYRHVVKSPTYNLVEIYKISRLYLYHFDFYRFNDPLEWEEAGFREYFNPASICIVEWPEKAEDLLPMADLQITIKIHDKGRSIEIRGRTELGKQCLQQWNNQEIS